MICKVLPNSVGFKASGVKSTTIFAEIPNSHFLCPLLKYGHSRNDCIIQNTKTPRSLLPDWLNVRSGPLVENYSESKDIEKSSSRHMADWKEEIENGLKSYRGEIDTSRWRKLQEYCSPRVLQKDQETNTNLKWKFFRCEYIRKMRVPVVRRKANKILHS